MAEELGNKGDDTTVEPSDVRYPDDTDDYNCQQARAGTCKGPRCFRIIKPALVCGW
jgi:hypothetical protein